jgi:hypothetical protein
MITASPTSDLRATLDWLQLPEIKAKLSDAARWNEYERFAGALLNFIEARISVRLEAGPVEPPNGRSARGGE